jgi:hypothetical protein
VKTHIAPRDTNKSLCGRRLDLGMYWKDAIHNNKYRTKKAWNNIECEHCGHNQTLISGYNDDYYHNHILPKISCNNCKKDRTGFYIGQPSETKSEAKKV